MNNHSNYNKYKMIIKLFNLRKDLVPLTKIHININKNNYKQLKINNNSII